MKKVEKLCWLLRHNCLHVFVICGFKAEQQTSSKNLWHLHINECLLCYHWLILHRADSIYSMSSFWKLFSYAVLNSYRRLAHLSEKPICYAENNLFSHSPQFKRTSEASKSDTGFENNKLSCICYWLFEQAVAASKQSMLYVTPKTIGNHIWRTSKH